MGVTGLFRVVNGHGLLKDYKLTNSRLVIDGHNLGMNLYNKRNTPKTYGGDYTSFGKDVQSFFNNLKKCDVKPYVVFDGATAVRNLKDLEVGTEKEEKEKKMKKEEKLKNLFPLLSNQTFQHILNDLEIPNVTCDWEADKEIADLANKWECPVLTDDSDFFLYDLKAGCISLDFDNLQPCRCQEEQESYYMNVKIYKFDLLLSHFGIGDRRMVPLMATLLKDDYVKYKSVAAFIYKKIETEREDALGKNAGKIKRLLYWLGSKTSFDEAVSEILEKTSAARDDIKSSVASFTVSSTSSLAVYFETIERERSEPKGACSVGQSLPSDLKSHDGSYPPQWFIRQVRGGLPGMLMNVYANRRAFLHPQVETLTEACAHQCASSIRQATYAILFNSSRFPRKPRNDGCHQELSCCHRDQ